MFNGSNELAKKDSQNEEFSEDCLYLQDPQEEEFICQLDTRLSECEIPTSNAAQVPDLNSELIQPTEVVNQSEEFLATEKIISELQIGERSDLLENSPNLQFEIDPSFAENIGGDSTQNELSNFNDSTIFDTSIEPNFEEPIETVAVPFEETSIQEEQIETDLQQNLEENLQQELQTDLEIQKDIQLGELPEQLFTDFPTEAEVLQENLNFEEPLEMETTILDQSQIQGEGQIFESEALPGLSQQESNLFFEELGQMEGNFPEEQDFKKDKEEKSEKDSGTENESQPLEPPPMFELNLMEEFSSDPKSQKPLQPPPMFDPMEAFPDLLEESNQEAPLQPPPMFELEPDFMEDHEERSNSSIRRSRKLDHREESGSFDPQQQQQQQQQKHQEVLQPPPAFDPRGPQLKVPGFTQEVIQPPKVFDPRLSSQQRMDFVSTTEITSWAGPIDYMAPNFVPPMISQPFIPTVGYNMVIPPLAIEFPPLPQENQVAPPLPVEPVPVPAPVPVPVPVSAPFLSMDDELEDMQEAMEFATQLMNMTENGEKSDKKEKRRKSERKKETKGKKKDVEYGPLLPEMMEEKEESLEKGLEELLQTQLPVPVPVPVPGPVQTADEEVFADDQIRPKVVFNLNKVKRICKVDEWQQQQQPEDVEDLKGKKKKFLKEKEKEKENQISENQEEKEDVRRRRRRSKDRKDENRREEKGSSRSEDRASTSKEEKKEKKETSENQESWKNRVIKQFLSMDRNDFHNMINNTSRRRFDIAMKQLVKERKTSLSQEMRNNEEEKVRHFDRDQFMTQLNQMLDPEASESVDISNLPTEFIHHLSMVLHLDPMPGGEEGGGGGGGGELEMMDSEDFLQQMGLGNKNQRSQEQGAFPEEEYLHLPNEPSPSVQPTTPTTPVEKKKRHHDKKVHVHVIRVKDPSTQAESHEGMIDLFIFNSLFLFIFFTYFFTYLFNHLGHVHIILDAFQ